MTNNKPGAPAPAVEATPAARAQVFSSDPEEEALLRAQTLSTAQAVFEGREVGSVRTVVGNLLDMYEADVRVASVATPDTREAAAEDYRELQVAIVRLLGKAGGEVTLTVADLLSDPAPGFEMYPNVDGSITLRTAGNPRPAPATPEIAGGES